MRAVLEMVGVQDCLTKSFGSNNSKNLVKAVMDGLGQLRNREDVEALRGVKVGTTAIEAAITRSEELLHAGGSDAGDQEQAAGDSEPQEQEA